MEQIKLIIYPKWDIQTYSCPFRPKTKLAGRWIKGRGCRDR